jgi:hypothetical protein
MYDSHTTSPSYDYHIYVHANQERDRDVLDHFAYGGLKYLNGSQVHIHKLPISPYLLNSSLDGLHEHTELISQVEAYLRGDPRFKNGVQIPYELMSNPIQLPTPSNDIYFRFPVVETLLGTLAARLSYPRLAHPFGQPIIENLQRFVSPKFPVLRNPFLFIKDLHPPDLPYVRAQFLPFERCHPDESNLDLPFQYFGCLPRYEAFLFQKNFPIYAPQLYHEATATLQLVALHADPKTRPPLSQGGCINWEGILEPYGFSDYFPNDTESRLLFRACPRPSRNNSWFPRTHFILQCARHINQLIRSFKTFFTTLECSGFQSIVRHVAFNREVDFLYTPVLSYGQAAYFTTLYDFLLREHALFLARPILQLLHIAFPEPNHLNLVFDHIINEVERPLYSYLLPDEDGTDFSSPF